MQWSLALITITMLVFDVAVWPDIDCRKGLEDALFMVQNPSTHRTPHLLHNRAALKDLVSPRCAV